jgi:hypothetical protein
VSFDLVPVAVLLAIAPGYVLISVATTGRTGRELKPDLHLVVQSLVLSAVVLAIAGPFAYAQLWPVRNDLASHSTEVALWAVGVVAAGPYVAGRVVRALRDWVRERPASWLTAVVRAAAPESPPPTLWDWASITQVMANRFVVVEYRDGRRVAGAHGRPGVTLSSPEEHGIYLAVEWKADDDGGLERIDNTAGVLVPINDDVRCVHLFNEGEEPMSFETKEVKGYTTKVARPDEEKGITPHKEPPPTRPPARPAEPPKQDPPKK